MTSSLRWMGPVAFAAFGLLSLSACGRAQAESPAARVDKLLAAWNGKDSPGCAVGISRNGAIVYEHGYGMANLELNMPNTPETVFAVASITKSFTAMSVLLAAEQGSLSLDDEVQKYIPGGVIATITSPFATCSRIRADFATRLRCSAGLR